MTRAESVQHIEKIKWAIWFAQLSNFKGIEWGKLQKELCDFMVGAVQKRQSGVLGGPDLTRENSMELCAGATERDMSKLQREMKRTLFSLVCFEEVDAMGQADDSEGTVFVGLPATPIGSDELLPIKSAQLSVYGSKPGEPFEWQIQLPLSANLQTSALAALFRHLVSSRIRWSQLRKCPECQRIFLVDRKPRPDRTFHCSKSCQWNASTRRYRAKERERSHRRYKTKVRKREHMANVRVARLPRKSTAEESAPTIEFVRGAPVSIAHPGEVGLSPRTKKAKR